ncbi:hypothetical protein ABZX12_18590 [Kribbella sp. NPDC003505]|uniref:hypothetical protein n=1 Tax=Kribbella sp. NPDC003505 TaxID=3154448 RepID=UPI0033A8A8FB
MTAREEIAAAASTVEGVECSPTYQVQTTPGQAYVQWMRTEYPNRLGGEDYWAVIVTLPSDAAAAQEWIEAHKAALVAALKTELIVTQALPQISPETDNPSKKILAVEGHRESEE